jgi:glycosyltransferase involved in cell wall biosynthesis
MRLAIEPLSTFRRKQIASKFFLNNIKKKIQLKKNHIITTHYLPFYDIALFATTDKSFYNKPFILRLDGIYIDKHNTIKDSNFENKKIFNSIEKSSGIIFNSNFSKKIVEKFYKKIDKPNIVISNGIDHSLFRPRGDNLRESLGIKNDEIVLITCAFWRRHKRLKETINFFNKLIKIRKEKFKLIVIGPKNKDFITNDNIIFSGYIQNCDLPMWYRTADFYIHLSWIEANSNSQCEAISCGLPVLCSNNGGNKENVKELNVGIVSKCDEQFNYEMIDLYNPPEPNYDILLQDFDKLINQRRHYEFGKNLLKINLDLIADKYFKFIQDVYKNINNR